MTPSEIVAGLRKDAERWDVRASAYAKFLTPEEAEMMQWRIKLLTGAADLIEGLAHTPTLHG